MAAGAGDLRGGSGREGNGGGGRWLPFPSLFVRLIFVRFSDPLSRLVISFGFEGGRKEAEAAWATFRGPVARWGEHDGG